MRLAIADDHGIFRTALARSLADIGGDVLVSVARGDDLLAALETTAVDAAVVDVAMPPSGGIAVAQAICSRHPRVGVLLLSAYTATPQAIDLLRKVKRGVGYLLKENVGDVTELQKALDRIVAGESVIDRSIVRRLLAAPAQDQALSRLSTQEREVLRLMAEGFSNAGISARLFIANSTVEVHVSRIFVKLGLAESMSRESNKRVLAVLTWLRLAGMPSYPSGTDE